MRSYALTDDNTYRDMMAEYGPFPGIYRLHIRADTGAFDALPRLLGTDMNGVLYIGTSLRVPERIGSLRKSLHAAYKKGVYKATAAHQCGKKIVQCKKFVERFPFEKLCLTVQPCSQPDQEMVQKESGHTKLEWRLLTEYFSEFGEFPPLNG